MRTHPSRQSDRASIAPVNPQEKDLAAAASQIAGASRGKQMAGGLTGLSSQPRRRRVPSRKSQWQQSARLQSAGPSRGVLHARQIQSPRIIHTFQHSCCARYALRFSSPQNADGFHLPRVHFPPLACRHILVIAVGDARCAGLGKYSVVNVLDEHERTMAFAEIALGQIKSLRQTAIPRNYEIWYVYATGYNPPLNKIINETLARNGRLTESDLEQIYETYLSHLKITDRIDKVGARVIGEIDDVMSLITDALGVSVSYDATLSEANEKLSAAGDRDTVKPIIEMLIKATGEMRETNTALEERLTLSKTEISNLQQSLEAIRAESLTDPLTGLGNRKYFDRMIDVAVQNALANNEPLSLLMFDIDHFKSFNDSYGHLTGDQVLRLVSNSLKQTIKGQDITARYGGEEFAVVLPNTALRQALTVADHIRRAVMAKELKKKSTGEILGRVTISVGVSMLKPGDDTDALIERADACLYVAKRNGRNRVICEVDPEYATENHGQACVSKAAG
jgi:diguanylate cyclase